MGLITGGVVQFRNYEQRLEENAPSNSLNPAVGPHMDLAFRHSLLQGFGIKLNDRAIRIGKINTGASIESFRSQLLNLVAGVLNSYWDLVSADDELQARRRSQANAQKFFEDTQKEIAAGAIPRVEISRAAAEVATRRQDLVVSEANLRQRGNALKELLVRVPDPAVEAAEIIALDRIQIPDNDDLPPLRTMVTTAMAKRPDVMLAAMRDQTSEISLAGTANPLLPTVQVTAQTFNRGVAGTPQVNGSGSPPNPYFVGGYGTALGQVFRRNFPNYSAGVSISAPLGNRTGARRLRHRPAYSTANRSSRRSATSTPSWWTFRRAWRRCGNRARAIRRRWTRVSCRSNCWPSDRSKFASGMATFTDIINDQRALVVAQISEVNALSAYAHARVSLDQTLGETLERNGVTLDEGLSGKVKRESRPPDVLGKESKDAGHGGWPEVARATVRRVCSAAARRPVAALRSMSAMSNPSLPYGW